MSSVDNRIVQMQFDNKQFESGIQTSIKSLDNLKKGLNLEESAKSLSNLQQAGREFTLASISSSVDAIAQKFTALGIIGTTALVNITNSVMNTGLSMIKSLTIDPIKMGLDEYETKMNSIQTILTNTQSKGTTIDQVNVALNQLNEYADKTIYNFAEMTRNIGTFTAAGVDLQTSVTSIKGIANLAAGSGSNAQQASTAMYQLSQAIAAGSVKLQDWNSVVNAGMGGELFQKALEKTAKELGHGRDMGVSFRESLEKGWITTEVLTKTLAKFANDKSLLQAATQVKTFTQLFDTMKESVQSGWSQTWETIIGNKDEAAKMLTGINDVFGGMISASADARNAMLAFWKANGGRDAIIQSLVNVFNGLMSVLRPIGQAFREIFPAATGKGLVTFSKGLQELTSHLKIGEGTAYNLKMTFKGLFAIIDIGIKILGFFVDIIGKVVGVLLNGTGGLMSALIGVTGMIGRFISGIRDIILSNTIFITALEKLGLALNYIKSIVVPIGNALVDAFNKAGVAITPYIIAMEDAIKSSTLFQDVTNNIKYALEKLSEMGGKVVSWIKGFSDVDFGTTVVYAKELGSSLDGLADSGTKVKTSFFSWINGALDKMTTAFKIAGTYIKDKFGPVIEYLHDCLKKLTLGDVGRVLTGGGILLMAKSFKDAVGSFKDIAKGFSGVIEGITGSLEAFQTKLKADAMFRIASAIGLLALSVVALSMIDEKALSKALDALAVIFIELSAAMIVLDKASMATTGLSGRLVALGAAVLVMSIAMTKLSKIDNKGLMQGVEGLAGILTSIALFTKITSGKAIESSMTGLIGLSISVLILTKAMENFSKIDPKAMETGIKGITASLVSLALFIKLVGNPERMIALGVGVNYIAVAMNVLSFALARIGSLPVDKMKQGIAGIAAMLLSMGLAIRLIPNEASMIAIGIGLNLMAVSLYTMAGAIAIFGSISTERLSTGIEALAVSLLIMGGAARLMTGTLSGAAALAVMALSINMLVPAIALLGTMNTKSIGMALLAIAGVFVVLGVSALALKPLAPIILSLSGSVALLGAGMFLMGAGLVAFSVGLAALTAGGYAFSKAFISFMTTIIESIPAMADKIASAFRAIGLALITVFSQLTIPVVTAAMNFIMALLNKILEYVEPMTSVALKILVGFLKGIEDNVEMLIQVGIDIVLKLLDGVVSKIPDIIAVGVKIIEACLEGIGKALPRLIAAGVQLIIDFVNGLAVAVEQKTPELINAFVNLAVAIIKGLADGLFSGVKTVLIAIGEVGKSIIDGFASLLGIHSPSRVFADFGYYIIQGLINGIRNTIGSAVSAMGDVVWSIKDKVSNNIGEFVDAGKNVVQGFIDGIKSKIWAAASWAGDLASSVLDSAKRVLGIHSPSRAFAEIGRYSGEGFIVGLNKYSSKVASAASDIGNTALDSMSNAISGISDSISNGINNSPVIRPVIDLTDVQNGTKMLNNMIAGTNRYNVSGSVDLANKTAHGIQSNNMANNSSPTASNTTVTNTTPITNNFNITGNNPTEIANEVSRILQKQVERRETVWV